MNIMTDDENQNLFAKIDDVLKNVDLSTTTSEGAGFEELKPGYYLGSVDNAQICTSKSSGNPQVKVCFTVAEDGIAYNTDDAGNVEVEVLKGSKGRKIFKYYPLKDAATVKRFVSDMLKFEDQDGNSILPAEAFTTAAVLADALDAIAGMQVYLQLTVSGEGETKTTWTNLISWKRAAQLELPQ